MLFEALIATGAFTLAMSIYRLKFKKIDESLTIRIEFITDNGKIPFLTKKYDNWKDFDFVQDQLLVIGNDPVKNMYLRDVNIKGISLTEVLSNEEFFYTVLKKDT